MKWRVASGRAAVDQDLADVFSPAPRLLPAGPESGRRAAAGERRAPDGSRRPIGPRRGSVMTWRQHWECGQRRRRGRHVAAAVTAAAARVVVRRGRQI